MAGQLRVTPDAIVQDRVQKFTRTTNYWARLMRGIMTRTPDTRHTIPLVMWREVPDGDPQRGEWLISKTEQAEFERLLRLQGLALSDIESAVGVNQAAEISAKLITMMRERYPDLVDWTEAQPVRESLDSTEA